VKHYSSKISRFGLNKLAAIGMVRLYYYKKIPVYHQFFFFLIRKTKFNAHGIWISFFRVYYLFHFFLIYLCFVGFIRMNTFNYKKKKENEFCDGPWVCRKKSSLLNISDIYFFSIANKIPSRLHISYDFTQLISLKIVRTFFFHNFRQPSPSQYTRGGDLSQFVMTSSIAFWWTC